MMKFSIFLLLGGSNHGVLSEPSKTIRLDDLSGKPNILKVTGTLLSGREESCANCSWAEHSAIVTRNMWDAWASTCLMLIGFFCYLMFTSIPGVRYSDLSFEYFRIPDPLADRMLYLVTQKRNDQKLTFEDLVIAKGIYEKGTKDEIEQFLYQLLDVTNNAQFDRLNSQFGRSNLQAILAAILDDLFPLKDDESRMKSRECIIDEILNAITFSNELGDTKSMAFEDYRDLCAHIPSLRKYLGSLLQPPDAGRTGSQVPRLVYPESYESNIILREEYAWLLSGLLSQTELVEWKILYHSSYNGMSFNTFLGNVSTDEGPTLLIIKDTEGYIYGGYASQSWQKHSDFYGDLKCFLFQLHPKVSIYRPTGANNNLQWCAVNYSSESIPNGIGFGGKVHHFGLFVTANFDAGESFDCTTFGSPCLAKSTRFRPEVIECWNVFPQEVKQKGSNALKGTVLDRFKEDRNMLNLVGLANSSQ